MALAIELEVIGAGILYEFMKFEIQGAQIDQLNPSVDIVSMLSVGMKYDSVFHIEC